jgi:D-alanine-D-alanine ligase
VNTANRIVILHGRVPAEARADEQDVLVEVRQVSDALNSLGYEAVPLSLSLDLEAAAGQLRRLSPLMVFNLVESIDGQDRLLHLATSLLDSLGIPHTGTGGDGMYLASNKPLAKRLLAQAGIATPPWIGAQQALAAGLAFEPPYIVKSVWDNASQGLENIIESKGQLRDRMTVLASTGRLADVFVERYIEGREFNLSLLQNGPEAEVLPPAEMLFVDYPPEMPRIVGYSAKWDPASFEYNHTVRRFDFGGEDEQLIHELCELARACWEQLGIGGYARVDFRVDDQGIPWILEVNPNPCISVDAGLAAAAARAGYPYRNLVQRILQPVLAKIACGNCGAEVEAFQLYGGRRSGS